MRPIYTVLAAVLVLAACSDGPSQAAAPIGSPQPLPTPAGVGSGEPNLTVDASGRVHMSWLEATGPDTHALRWAALEDGRWTEPRTIHEGGEFWVNWADFPSIEVLPDGSMAAHWLARSGPGTYDYNVNVSRSFDGGGAWTDPIVPHRDGTQAEHGFVSLFPADDGALAAIWLDGRKYAAGTEEMTLRYTTIDPDGTLGDEVLIDSRACDCCQTDVALTSEGPVAVYRDRSPDEVRDIVVTRLRDGAWSEARPVHADGWEIDACPVNGPAVAAEDHRVAVAWFTAARDTPRVAVAFSEDAGASFGPPTRADAGHPIGRVDLVLLPDGDAVVSWLERTDSGAEVRVRRVRRDGAISEATTVARSSAARASGFPRMVRAGEDLVFAWTQAGDSARVHVARARLEGS